MELRSLTLCSIGMSRSHVRNERSWFRTSRVLNLVTLAVVVWTAWPVVGHLVGRRRVAALTNVRLGMTTTEVARAMGREPDCVVRVGRTSVAYYAGHAADLLGRPPCDSPGPREIAIWDDLPVVYAAAEIAFDASGRAVALGLCGEGGAKSIRGRPQDCMKFLTPDARPN
jgi:hypothetical protein